MPRSLAQEIIQDSNFPGALRVLMAESKYPMSLFLSRTYVFDLLTDKAFDGKQFQQLFDLFLSSSKLYATNKACGILRELPDDLSSESKANLDNSFLTKISDCFRISVVINFYNWIPKQGILENEILLTLIQEYKRVFKATYSNCKYKKMKLLINYLEKSISISPKKVILNSKDDEVVQKFISAKRLGLKIYNNGHLVSESSWCRQTISNNGKYLRQFLTKTTIEHEKKGEEFSVFDLNLDDFLTYQESYLCNVKLAVILKQFIAFMLEQKSVQDSQRSSLQELFLKIPSAKALKKGKSFSRSKNFITRKDYITLIQTALQKCIQKTRLRFSCYIGLAGFCALRRVEVMSLQINNFVLDEKLLIADLGGGYGQLHLDAKKSKGGYSPTHSEYGILIVPTLRNLLNLYLESQHMKGYDESTFIMRGKPVSQYDENFDNLPEGIFLNSKWLAKISSIAAEIMRSVYTKAQHCLDKYSGPISSHDLRRSINQFIKSSNTLVPQCQDRIAEIHLRHSKRGVNNISYTADPSFEAFIIGINRSLNFPWDLNLLEEWEEKNLLKFNNRDWGTTNGHKNVPNPYVLEKELLSSMVVFKEPYQAFDHQKNYASEKELSLRNQLNELNLELKNKNQNTICIEAKIMRIEKELLRISNGGTNGRRY